MKKGIILVLAVIISCSAPEKKSEPAGELIVRTLNDFFIRCEEDIKRAEAVILKHDIIKNLTHLKFMNAGGKKYYLLERESISDMINAVTVGVYADYILINKGGDIIYTRVNDDIFGRNVRTSLAKTPLKTCYEKRDIPVFFHDVSPLSKMDTGYYIFVSTKVKGGNTNPGIFILQFDVRKLREVLNEHTDIIGLDGTYRLSQKNVELGDPYPFFDRIDMNLKESPATHYFTTPRGGQVSYRFFNHGTISWILVKQL